MNHALKKNSCVTDFGLCSPRYRVFGEIQGGPGDEVCQGTLQGHQVRQRRLQPGRAPQLLGHRLHHRGGGDPDCGGPGMFRRLLWMAGIPCHRKCFVLNCSKRETERRTNWCGFTKRLSILSTLYHYDTS